MTLNRDSPYAARCIVEGMERYFRSFALADTMHHEPGEVEWIAPRPHASGPALVFKVALDERTAGERLDAVIPRVQAGTIPSLWVLTPASTPGNVMELLIARGFDAPSATAEPEPGMALAFEEAPPLPAPSPGVQVQQVRSQAGFAQWIDVVNEALHGWPMLDVAHYTPWLTQGKFSFYLACLNGVPVATAATIEDGDQASLEFVSTLKEHRCQGAATAACVEALRQLQHRGVRVVTLRSSSEAVALYERLGFRPYFEQVLIFYPKDRANG